MSSEELDQYMDDSEDDDDSTTRSASPEYTSYASRPEWADVEPISIKTQTTILDVNYTSRFEEAFSYFRAMLVRDELSERSLALTGDCIELQQSNFTVWYFRRRILKKLPEYLNDELPFVEKIIENEPKNYQVWHHRKTIVEWLQDGSHDKQLTASILAIDSKNYHAWQHRQWIIKEFNLWDGELEFTDTLLNKDIRNNSAWNHRFYVMKETQRHKDESWAKEELQLTHKRIQLSPTNESSWSYLRGFLLLINDSLNSSPETKEFCENLFTSNCRSPHLLVFMIDMISEELKKSKKKPFQPAQQSNELKERAIELCEMLTQIDKIRTGYWNHLCSKIKEL